MTNKLNENASQYIQRLQKDTGLNETQALSLMGNLSFESKGLHGINEDKPAVKNSRGGFGWAQWTGPRRKQFESFAKQNNLDVRSDEANYQFLVKELNNEDGNSPVPSFLSSLKNTKNVDEANKLTVNNFLFPEDKTGTLNQRKSAINNLAKNYNPSATSEDKATPQTIQLPEGPQDELVDIPPANIQMPTDEETNDQTNELEKHVTGYNDKDVVNIGGNSWEAPFNQTGNVGKKPIATAQTFENETETNGPNTVVPSSALPTEVTLGQQYTIDHPQGDIRPIGKMSETGMGIFATGLEALIRHSTPGQLGRNADFINAVHEGDEDDHSIAPAGWKWYTDLEPLLANIPSKYYPKFAWASTPQQRDNIFNWIYKDMERDEAYANGSWVGAFPASIAAGFASPDYLFPFGAIYKASKISSRVLANILETVPNVTAGSIAHNALIQSVVVGGNLSDFAYDSFTDSVIGSIMVAGIKQGLNTYESKYAKARKGQQYDSEGIIPKWHLEADGSINKEKPWSAGYVQPSAYGGSASAMKVAEADIFYKSGIAKEGLFQWDVGFHKMAKWLTPTFRGLSSENPVVPYITNRLFNHVIKTVGNVEHEAHPLNFESRNDFYRDETTAAGIELEKLFYEANSLESGSGPIDSAKRFGSQVKNGLSLTKEEWGNSVMLTKSSGNTHSNGFVNRAVVKFNDAETKIWNRAKDAFGYGDEDDFITKTAAHYAANIYTRSEMQSFPDRWNKMSIESMQDQNKLIDLHMNPIIRLQDQIDRATRTHKERELTKDYSAKQRVKAQLEIDAMKRKSLRLKRALADKAQSSEEFRMAIKNHDGVSGETSIEMNDLFKVRDDLKKELSKQKSLLTKSTTKTDKTKKAFAALNKKRAKLDTIKFKTKSKNVKTIAKQKEKFAAEYEAKKAKLDAEVLAKENEFNMQESERNSIEAKHNDAALAHDKEVTRLDVDLDNGAFPQSYYTWAVDENASKLRTFKNPNNLYTLKETIEPHEMEGLARATYEKILGTTDGDILSEVTNELLGYSSENPVLARTHMIAQSRLIKNGFIETDPSKVLQLYGSRLNRMVALKEALPGLTEGDGGFRGLMKKFKEINDEKRIKINEIENPAERQAANEKMAKDEANDIKLIKDFMFRASGKKNGSLARQQLDADAKNLAAATMLGNVALTMITDPTIIMFKNGVWPVIKNLPRPLLDELSRGGKNKAFAKKLYIALEGEINTISNRWGDGVNSGDIGSTGVISSTLKKLSNATAKYSFVNALNNLQERVYARINEATILERLQKYEDGTISKSETQWLLQYGIEPKTQAKKMLSFAKKYGNDKESNFQDWPNQESQRIFVDGIRRSIRDILFRKDLSTNPAWTNEPIIGLAALFKSWAFTSFARAAIPAMQTPDANKAIGFLLSSLMGSMVTPLRRIARGEEPFQDDDKMMVNAVTDGLVLALPMDIVQNANTLFSGAFFGDWLADKRKWSNPYSVFLGPVGGLLSNAASSLGHVLKGDATQTDVKKFARNIPYLNLFHTQKFVIDAINNSDIPVSR